MKKKHIISASSLAFVALLLLWYYFSFEHHTPSLSDDGAAPNGEITSEVNSRTNTKRITSILTPIKRAIQFNEGLKDSLNQFKTPIEFYGLVLDETGHPVEGAEAYMSWTDLSPNGHSERIVHSDARGLFVLSNVIGYYLSVRVEKTDYYTSISNRTSFPYAGQDLNFKPDQLTPIVYHLQKRKEAEPLIVMRGNLNLAGYGRGFKVSKDGAPTHISLVRAAQVGREAADLIVECWTAPKSEGTKRYDWKCRISILEGGLIQTEQEFNFEAPLEGYEPRVEIQMPASLKEAWQSNFERKYFLRLRNGNYGRMNFKMVAAGDHFCVIESFVNPSGSRNLEYDSKVQPKPGTVFE